MIDNVFGYFAKDQGHYGEEEDACDEVRAEKTFCVRFLHESVGQTEEIFHITFLILHFVI